VGVRGCPRPALSRQAGQSKSHSVTRGRIVAVAMLADAHELRRFRARFPRIGIRLRIRRGRPPLISSTGNVWTTGARCRSGCFPCSFPPRSRSRRCGTRARKTYAYCAVRRRAPHAEPSANRPLPLEGRSGRASRSRSPYSARASRDVIPATLDAAREAARRYREETGARCKRARQPRTGSCTSRATTSRGARGRSPHGAS